MRTCFIGSLLALTAAIGLALGQAPRGELPWELPPPAEPDSDRSSPPNLFFPPDLTPAPCHPIGVPVLNGPNAFDPPTPCGRPGSPGFAGIWLSGEYLLWWIKDGPPPASRFTADGFGYGDHSGLRVSGGVGSEGCPLGLEGGAFLLERRMSGFPIDSGSMRSSSRLWGGEANGVGNLFGCKILSLDLLAGWRYLDLGEDLDVVQNSPPLTGSAGRAYGWDARNQFHGGQVGAQAGLHFWRVSLGLLGKVALGSTHQVVNVPGASIPRGIVGLSALAGNNGRYREDHFAVVPETAVSLSLLLTENACFSAGYTFLYWSDVVRPGDPFSPLAPSPSLKRDDFFAHGLNFGLAFRY